MGQERPTLVDNEMIKNRFGGHFRQFITERTEDIWKQTNVHSPELKELSKELDAVYNKLEAGLNAEQKTLLNEYAESQLKNEAYQRQVIYELGFVDGIKIATETDEEIVKIYPIFEQI